MKKQSYKKDYLYLDVLDSKTLRELPVNENKSARKVYGKIWQAMRAHNELIKKGKKKNAKIAEKKIDRMIAIVNQYVSKRLDIVRKQLKKPVKRHVKRTKKAVKKAVKQDKKVMKKKRVRK